MKYFRSTPAVYASICAQLDEAYGYPNDAGTLRTLPLAETLPHDAQGRVYCNIPAYYCEYTLPSEMLPELLASGAVEEVSEAVFAALLPTP